MERKDTSQPLCCKGFKKLSHLYVIYSFVNTNNSFAGVDNSLVRETKARPKTKKRADKALFSFIKILNKLSHHKIYNLTWYDNRFA